jgi:hypothetical protein
VCSCFKVQQTFDSQAHDLHDQRLSALTRSA